MPCILRTRLLTRRGASIWRNACSSSESSIMKIVLLLELDQDWVRASFRTFSPLSPAERSHCPDTTPSCYWRKSFAGIYWASRTWFPAGKLLEPARQGCSQGLSSALKMKQIVSQQARNQFCSNSISLLSSSESWYQIEQVQMVYDLKLLQAVQNRRLNTWTFALSAIALRCSPSWSWIIYAIIGLEYYYKYGELL